MLAWLRVFVNSLRLDLRPSWVLQGALIALAVLGVLALWLSALPRVAWLLVPVLVAISLWRLRSLPRGQLVLHSGGQAEWWPQRIDSGLAPEPSQAEGVRLQLRGPLAVLRLRIQQRIVRWPLASDTLPAAQARALRLWIDRHARPVQDANPTPPP